MKARSDASGHRSRIKAAASTICCLWRVIGPGTDAVAGGSAKDNCFADFIFVKVLPAFSIAGSPVLRKSVSQYLSSFLTMLVGNGQGILEVPTI